MSIDWLHFTPSASLVGGALLGVAVSLLLLFNGRIAGISGILGGLLRRDEPAELRWRVAFVAGVIAAPLLFSLFAELPAGRIDASPLLVVASGLLVGYGTRLGSGCTCGHGVCGLSRLSLRSLVATLGFMVAGFLTVFVLRHVVA